jgi:hypothetical protein
VDGDGFDDLLAETGGFGATRAIRLLPGSAERLQGEVALAQRGAALEGFGPDGGRGLPVGDLDGDGLHDFLMEVYVPVEAFPEIGDVVYQLFYGGRQRSSSAIRPEQADASIRVPGGLGVVRAAGDWQDDGFDDLSLMLAIHPGTEALFRVRAPSSPEERELKNRSFNWEAVQLHLLSGGRTRMSGEYAPPVFRPDLTPPPTEIPTRPERHLYPGGTIGDFDGDGRADLTFIVTGVYGGLGSSAYIKFGAPAPLSRSPLR